MHRSLVVALALALSTASISASVSAQDRDEGGEQAMLDAINAQRAADGAPALVRDPRLDAAARRHSEEMAARDVLEHVSEGSGTPADRVHAEGLAIQEIAENVAMHHASASAQSSLEASAPHLANMRNPRFTHVGIASVRDENGLYVTQVFGRIEESAADAPAIAPPDLGPPAVLAPPTDAPSIALAPQSDDAVVVAPQSGVIAGSVVQGAPGGTPTVMVPSQQTRPVSGYWVCAQSRWWYYPMPRDAAPGQQLQADLSVTGAPPGYAPGACVAGTAPVMAPPPPPVVYQQQPPVYSAPVYAPPVYAPRYAPRVYAPRVYAQPPVYYAPRVYAPPPPRGPRYIVVPPRPGTIIAPYAGPGVSFELGLSPRPHGRIRVRRR